MEEFVGAGGLEDAGEVWIGDVFYIYIAIDVAAEDGGAFLAGATMVAEGGVVFERGVGGGEDAGTLAGEV